MVEKQNGAQRANANKGRRGFCSGKTHLFLCFALGGLVLIPVSGRAQYQDLNSAPIQSTNPSGAMSTRDMQLQQVRQQAQALQGEAASASMARSADRSIDQQNRDRAVQEARELKAMKRNAAERLKWERANARQVQKVSSDDMNSWTTSSGNVRVERDVPNAFIASLIAEEESAMRRGTLEKKKKRLSPRDLNPFRKDDPIPQSSAPVMVQQANPEFSEPLPEKKGFFSKVKIPGFGNKEDDMAADAIPEAPVFRSEGGDSTPAPLSVASQSSPEARSIPQRSGAALVDGGAAPAVPASSTASNSGTAPQLTSFAPASEPEKEKGGLFSAFKKSEPEPQSMVPEKPKSNGGLFSFEKKKPDTDARSIDASLFPTGAAEQAPTGGSLTGGYTAEDVAEEMAAAPTNTGDVALPGAAPEKKKFSLPKPSLSFPTLASTSKPSGSDRSSTVPTMTTINSSGNDYYVVTDTAQFMVYGEDQMESEVRALRAGNVVRMTKPGEQWASIRLSNGTEGVVQNKFLRAASGTEASGQFAATN